MNAPDIDLTRSALIAYFRAAEGLFMAPTDCDIAPLGRAYDAAREAAYAALGELAPGVDGVKPYVFGKTQ